MQYITGTIPGFNTTAINDNFEQPNAPVIATNPISSDPSSNFSISDLNDGRNILLINNQTYRLSIYCMSLWFWISSGITYFGVVIADDHDLPNTIKILFYLILCAVSLMIAGIISTAVGNTNKCIKYSSGIMWLLSGLCMIAVVCWEFHINYNDSDWKQRHNIYNYSPALYLFSTFANYLPLIFITFIISAEILFNYGAKYIYLNLKLFLCIIFVTSTLWLVPCLYEYEGANNKKKDTITIIFKISYAMIAISSFLILIIFVFINKLKHIYCVKYVIIIFVFILNISGVAVNTFYSDGSEFNIYAQEPSGHLHSNFVWLLCITYCCYLIFIINSSVFNKDLSKKTGLIINDSNPIYRNNDPFMNYSMNVNLHTLDINLDNNEVESADVVMNNIKSKYNYLNNNILNNKTHRMCLYCLCLFYWVVPDLFQSIMIQQELHDTLSKTARQAIYLLTAAFVVDIASILIMAIYLMLDIQRVKWVPSILFVCGGILMAASRIMTYEDVCSNIDNKQETIYCGIAQISTYLIGILLPIWIACDFQWDFQIGRTLCNLLIFFIISLSWCIVIYRYDVDVDYGDIMLHQKFRKDIQFVVRMGWIMLIVSCGIMVILCILKIFSIKIKIITTIFIVMFLISTGVCVIDKYGGGIAQNPIDIYPDWTAAFPVNSYWTLFLFAIILCYDVSKM